MEAGGNEMRTRCINEASESNEEIVIRFLDEEHLESVAHEIWAVSLTLPGQGIEDAALRIIKVLKDNKVPEPNGKLKATK